MNKGVKDTHMISIEAFIDFIDKVDGYTGKHCKKVSELAAGLAEKLGFSASLLDIIKSAGQLHDIGKIRIPKEILSKKGKYNKEEYDIMKQHSSIGCEILSPMECFKKEIPIIRHHHEGWDGKGYPDGISGNTIPLGARILAVCDSYEAMTNPRPYKDTLSHEQAIEELIKNKGTQFDPEVVDAFVEMLKEKGNPSKK